MAASFCCRNIRADGSYPQMVERSIIPEKFSFSDSFHTNNIRGIVPKEETYDNGF